MTSPERLHCFLLKAKICKNCRAYNENSNPQKITAQRHADDTSLIKMQLLTIVIDERGDAQHVERAQNFINVSHCDVGAVFVHMVEHVGAATSAVCFQRLDVLKTSEAAHIS